MSGLFLGPVAFTDFEVPARIVFGGRQRLATHSLFSGGRVIDAMGRDDAPLAWTGTFSGPEAASRALQLDLMRVQGSVWPLAWDVFSYRVVISEFVASYERGNWIPYKIVCSVVADATATLLETALSITETAIADLATANGIAGVDGSGATAALSLAGAVSPGSNTYTAARIALSNAVAIVTSGIADAGMRLGAASDFSSAADLARQMAQLATAQGYVLRAQGNLTNVGN